MTNTSIRTRLALVLIFLTLTVTSYAEGRLIHIERTDSTTAMCIYTPDTDSTTYHLPVLYLLHGICSNQHTWIEQGRIVTIMDSLIACKAITPMLVVMPYCFTASNEDECTRLFTRYHNLRKGCFEQLFPSIMHYVESTFTPHLTSNHRYIAGISSGARQALNLSNYVACHTVGLFSAILNPKQYPTPHTDKHLPYYWITVGSDDYYRYESKKLSKHLTKIDIPHELHYRKGHHNWLVWRKALVDFLLFIAPTRSEE